MVPFPDDLGVALDVHALHGRDHFQPVLVVQRPQHVKLVDGPFEQLLHGLALGVPFAQHRLVLLVGHRAVALFVLVVAAQSLVDEDARVDVLRDLDVVEHGHVLRDVALVVRLHAARLVQQRCGRAAAPSPCCLRRGRFGTGAGTVGGAAVAVLRVPVAAVAVPLHGLEPGDQRAQLGLLLLDHARLLLDLVLDLVHLALARVVLVLELLLLRA